MSRLTQHVVNTAQAGESTDRLLSDGNGLYLRVQPGGTKSWIFRYRASGKAEKMRLGGLADMDLHAARKMASLHRAAVRDGGNPRVERIAGRASPAGSMTVRQFGPVYMEQKIVGASQYKHPQEVQRMLDAYLYPAMGDMLLRHVDADIAAEPLYQLVKRGKRSMANRALAQFKAFWDFARKKKLVELSPLALLTAKDVGGKEPPRNRKLAPAEVWRIFHMLDEDETRYAWQTRDALRMMLLTGQRSGEVLGALTRENLLPSIDDAQRWRIPLGFFKSSKHHQADHIVHLSSQARVALDILRYRTDSERAMLFVDPPTADGTPLKQGPATVRGLSQAVRSMLRGAATAKERAIAKHDRATPGALHGMRHWTPHDLRRTFATAAGELGVLPHVIEKCLNHKLEGILATYQQGDAMAERQAAMDLWGSVVGELLSRSTAPDAELSWADLRPRISAQVIAHIPRAA